MPSVRSPFGSGAVPRVGSVLHPHEAVRPSPPFPPPAYSKQHLTFFFLLQRQGSRPPQVPQRRQHPPHRVEGPRSPPSSDRDEDPQRSDIPSSSVNPWHRGVLATSTTTLLTLIHPLVTLYSRSSLSFLPVSPLHSPPSPFPLLRNNTHSCIFPLSYFPPVISLPLLVHTSPPLSGLHFQGSPFSYFLP
jgi:hypothetical protein